MGCLCHQYYMFVVTRTLARAEALVTELVFEHSLRIRLKAETSNDSPEAASVTSAPPTSKDAPAKDATAATTPETDGTQTLKADSASEVSASTAVASRVPSPVESDASTSKADQKGKTKANPDHPNGEKKSVKDSNFIGKLNNLVTTDLQNIVQGKDFLNLCEHPHSCPSECLLKK